MKKKLLFIGADSFLATESKKFFSNNFDIVTVGRKKSSNPDFLLDFNNIEILEKFKLPEDLELSSIIFFQGINPSYNLKESSYEHFIHMFNVNIFGPSIFLRNNIQRIADSGLVLFFSSIATKKGSYDPSYAASKSAILGLVKSLSNEFNNIRFNSISLGLVKGSPVYQKMTSDFREKHSSRMFKNTFIETKNVTNLIDTILENTSICNTDIALDGGFK